MADKHDELAEHGHGDHGDHHGEDHGHPEVPAEAEETVPENSPQDNLLFALAFVCLIGFMFTFGTWSTLPSHAPAHEAEVHGGHEAAAPQGHE